jgi:2-deoxy-D-gluconate 3-dehydrogenase
LSNNFTLHGKAALVTGGNGGIGLAMARALREAGAALAIAGRDSAKNAAAARELDAVALGCDVSKEGECRAMVDEAARRLGRLDVLLNNAGINVRKAPQDYSLEEWRLVIDTNLTSAFVASQAAYAHMKRAGGGKIINIGSMMSLFGASFAAPYGASKGGIVQLTKSLAAAWAKDNIQVNSILPGFIDTDLTRNLRRNFPEAHERVVNRTPARRWGDPADLAGTAVFFCSRASDFVTGTALPVDGGFSSSMF